MQFSTPLVLLSGCVGFGDEYTRVVGYSNEEVGAVCLKGTTLEPRKNIPFLIDVFDSMEGFDGDLVIAGMLGWKYEPIL